MGGNTDVEMAAAEEIADDARAKANVVRLAAAQALTGANSAVIFATGSIVGATLAPDMSLATVPLSMYVLGLAAGTLPTGAISRRLRPPRRLYHRHRLRRSHRHPRCLRDPAALVSAVLLRDVSWRPVWLGVAILSVRRGRWRQRRVSAQGRIVGDGGRRVRRRARSAARAMDHGYLAALSVRLQLRGAGRGRAGRDGDARRRRCAEACAVGSSRRPSAVRDRAAAALHRRRAVRRHRLSHDESGDDLGAAGHEDVRPVRRAIPISAFNGTSSRCMGRASSPAR